MPIADHRQNRAKDFVAHQRAVVARIDHHGRRNDALGLGAGRIDRRQRSNLMAARARFVEIAAQPAELAFVDDRSEEHTSELQSLMRISYAVFCLKKKKM